ncbi:MAG TPA: choice-of-anchor D domain-containing protein [Solirubrobacterales bacterium]|jgi:hypothetical protein|nr:choice-of-anchor D domain-containing protein [Solirubrobacterales bacterium]
MSGFTSRRQLVIAALAVLVALLTVPAAASACGPEAPPVITNEKATPSTLPWEGGTIRIEAEVTEPGCGVGVWLEITSSNGSHYPSQMLPTEETSNDNPRTYRAEFGAPANYQESPVYYQVAIRATDQEGGFTEAFAGETEVGAAPPFDEPPVISNATVKSLRIGSGGGGVTISADITDNHGVFYAWAAVMLPDETIKDVTLKPVTPTHFEGFFKAPANPGAVPQKYTAVVYAEDESALRDWEEAGSFTVSPLTGQLNAWTTEGSYFGRVVVGGTATRTVAVHNNGGPKTLPVEASITTSGAPFSIQGAIGGKVDFTIAPGETKTFVAAFNPTSLGYKTGSVIISRPDGAQPNVLVGLSGQGVGP